MGGIGARIAHLQERGVEGEATTPAHTDRITKRSKRLWQNQTIVHSKSHFKLKLIYSVKFGLSHTCLHTTVCCLWGILYNANRFFYFCIFILELRSSVRYLSYDAYCIHVLIYGKKHCCIIYERQNVNKFKVFNIERQILDS